MKYLIMLSILFSILMEESYAQKKDSVFVTDVSVMPVLKINETSDKQDVLVSFKISKIDSVSKVYILLGTQEKKGDLLTLELLPVKEGDVYYLTDAKGNKRKLLMNIEGNWTVTLPKAQWEKVKYSSVYVRKQRGGLTEHKNIHLRK